MATSIELARNALDEGIAMMKNLGVEGSKPSIVSGNAGAYAQLAAAAAFIAVAEGLRDIADKGVGAAAP